MAVAKIFMLLTLALLGFSAASVKNGTLVEKRRKARATRITATYDRPGSTFNVYFGPAKNWEDARLECQKTGGDLASLTNYEDIEMLKPYFTYELGTEWAARYWLGAKNPDRQKTAWKWLTGEPIPLNFAKWNAEDGSPKNGEEPNESGGDCLVWYWGLSDTACTRRYTGYVCQKLV